MAAADRFSRIDIEALLAAKLGTTPDDVRVTGSSRKIGAFEEFIMYLTAESEFPEHELHTLASYSGANFGEIDKSLARQWVAGRTLI